MIDPNKYGASFSVKQCHNFRIDPQQTLEWLIANGWKRFRLMSYWNEHEKQPGVYDFAELDRHIAIIQSAGGVVTLCLGVKQPRWPEYHWPKWTDELSRPAKSKALLAYVGTVVKRYKENPTIISWQLENEALLSNFGRHIDIDRQRLKDEYLLVKRLDQTRPIIMSTSNGWGIPVRQPRPDIVGFSLYLRRYEKGKYRNTIQSVGLHSLRKLLIRVLLRRQVFIHELQCEPWGPKPIWQMDNDEQDQSMSKQQILINLQAAKSIKASPVDLWGAEWWYWRQLHGDDSIWRVVSENVQ
ncbi:hypothetical protein BH09PAT4_BH09PAT4_05060 [soil metagenome]